MNSIIPVNPRRISDIIRITEPYRFGDKPKHFMSENIKGRFITKTGDRWVACDNTTGECWVEDFKTGREAVKWLCQA